MVEPCCMTWDTASNRPPGPMLFKIAGAERANALAVRLREVDGL